METPDWHYLVGWSHGKEKFNGEADYSKGSFYANPQLDFYEGHIGEQGLNRLYHNIWPNQFIPNFEASFKGLG